MASNPQEELKRMNKRKYKQLLSAHDPEKILGILGCKIPGFLDEKEIFHAILRQMVKTSQARIGILLTIEEERRQFVFSGAQGIHLSEQTVESFAWSLRTMQGKLKEGYEKPQLFTSAEIARRNDFIFERSMGFQSLFYQPLGIEGHVFGAVLLGNREARVNFSSEDMRRIKALLPIVCTEMERIWLYRELQSMAINMIHAFASAIEAKDTFTRGHSERVTKFSVEMARLLGWKKKTREVLRMSSIMHDIGKIGVPESILTKPGKLTAQEYAVIKRHPENGAEIVGKIPQMLQTLPGILCHHERYDGKGYPQGIGGKDIPEFGRLIAVADAFDAMTGTRPYRNELSMNTALEELRRHRGTQFDPEMVDVFLQAYYTGIIP
ncbi:HD domain-containing protein [bacterium]|nr:HD domain-containing protein [bacterium]